MAREEFHEEKNLHPLLSALALPALSAEVPDGFDPEQTARMSSRMEAFVRQGTIAGAVTLLQRRGGDPLLKTYGFQEIESKKPMRTDSIFQVMSMTKPVTAAGIMLLLEEGRLSLNDPVERHLPEFRGLWVVERGDDDARKLKRPSRPITIRDLLTHTSGMIGNPPPGIDRLYYTLDKTLAEAVAIYSQQPLDFEPGAKWQYSNPGIATLGRIIEVLADKPYEQFIHDRIFVPLGMKDSFFFPPDDKKDRIAMVYRLVDGKLKLSGPDTLAGDPKLFRRGAKYPLPEGGMFSTAQDMAAFYQMMLNRGLHNGKRFLSSATVEVMTAKHTGDIKPSWGLGWAVAADANGTLTLSSDESYSHGGAFATYGWIDPRRELIGVFLMQRTGPGGSGEREKFVAMGNAALR